MTNPKSDHRTKECPNVGCSDLEMETIARFLVSPGHGILAADESLPTLEKRFKSINVPSTAENRRAYREVLFTTSGPGH